MLRTPLLTPQHLEEYQRDGFVIARGAFTESDMDQIESWTTELASRPEEPGKHWVYHEKSKLDPEVELINRIEYISTFRGRNTFSASDIEVFLRSLRA
jgi:hypothetical protein